MGQWQPRYIVVVEHGANAAVLRPVGVSYVNWIGTVQPTNWLSGDAWDDTTTTTSPTASTTLNVVANLVVGGRQTYASSVTMSVNNTITANSTVVSGSVNTVNMSAVTTINSSANASYFTNPVSMTAIYTIIANGNINTNARTVTDDFTGTAGDNLSTRPQNYVTGATAFVISPSGTTVQKATTTTTNLNCVVALNTINQEASITVVTRGGGAGMGVIVRSDLASDNFYQLRATNAGVLAILLTQTAGFTNLADAIATIVDGDRITLRIVGSTLTASRNGVVISTVTNTVLTTGVHSGFKSGGSATQATMDNLSAADV